jgi:hypothetical protein
MKNKVEFQPPAELSAQIGEAVAPGTNLELMANFRVKEDGSWCIAAVEGVPFPGYDAQGNPVVGTEEKAPEGSKFAERYQQEMGNA